LRRFNDVIASIRSRPNFSRLRRFAWTAAALLPFVVFFLIAASPRASADAGVVLNESLDENVDRLTSTGHSAIYLSRVCSDSPVKLRLCRPGEQGSVLSNYINIGEDQPYEWNAVPLSVYLYGVENPANRPLFASYRIKRLLEDRYRQKYLTDYCTTESCRNSPKSEWREMVAATMIRGVYIFEVDTTVEQDLEFIAEFNDSKNKNHFNGVTRNCADFTMRVINTYFPHATKADYLNDFGMTSPKAVARTFTRYALHHPESHLRVMHFAQMPGTTKRSRIVRSGTEQLFHSGKLLVPMVLVSYYSVPVVTVSYFTTGRFNAQKEFEQHPADGLLPIVASSENPPQQTVGSDAQWKQLRKSLNALRAQNTDGANRNPERFFKQLDANGSPFLADDGSIWIDLSNDQKTARLGLSASNILAPDSNSSYAYELLFARASHLLKGPKRNRETIPEFLQDWDALQRVYAINLTVSPSNLAADQSRIETSSTSSAEH